MPDTMASCCSEPILPRIWAGLISAMYAGAITEAAPTPRPPTTRHTIMSTGPKARPEPIAEAVKSADGEEHHLEPADPVREVTGTVGANHAAEQGRGDHEPGQGRAHAEVVAHRADGAVDDGGVEAEQETAQRGDATRAG